MSNTHDIIASGLARRHLAERRFQRIGKLSLGFAALMLVILMATVLRPGLEGFTRHVLVLKVTAPSATAQPEIDYYSFTTRLLHEAVGEAKPEEYRSVAALAGFFAAHEVKAQLAGIPVIEWSGRTVRIALASNADIYLKRGGDPVYFGLSAAQAQWLDHQRVQGNIYRSFNREFFTRGDSRAPEAAGFLGSVMGSLLTLLVCLLLAVPIAIMAAITLEEFAKKTRIAEWLEIAINNLAAVPSIIYGLLGLSVFLQVMGAPRSSALAGGLTLAILILPVMIIAARAAIRAVPPSMRQAATALGATPLQVVRHHVLPYALPGIMTGTILSICRALGETAPLLMIGMVAFVADIPRHPLDPATAMPVQIYLWATSPEAGFIEKTSSGILVLLALLLLLNWVAIRVRNRSQLTWS